MYNVQIILFHRKYFTYREEGGPGARGKGIGNDFVYSVLPYVRASFCGLSENSLWSLSRSFAYLASTLQVYVTSEDFKVGSGPINKIFSSPKLFLGKVKHINLS